MKFCSNCGGKIEKTVPAGDDRQRYYCRSCGMVHYQNPKMVVGCIPIWQDCILMCRRAIEPCVGLWTIPAGYLENGETVAAGARREVLEEAKASVHLLQPYALYNLCFVNQVYFIFRSHLKTDDYGVGQESSEVRLFARDEIPWQDIAFEVIRDTLKHYLRDWAADNFSFYTATIERSPTGSVNVRTA